MAGRGAASGVAALAPSGTRGGAEVVTVLPDAAGEALGALSVAGVEVGIGGQDTGRDPELGTPAAAGVCTIGHVLGSPRGQSPRCRMGLHGGRPTGQMLR